MVPATYGIDLSHEQIVAESVHVASKTSGAFGYRDLLGMDVDGYLGLLAGIEAAEEGAPNEG